MTFALRAVFSLMVMSMVVLHAFDVYGENGRDCVTGDLSADCAGVRKLIEEFCAAEFHGGERWGIRQTTVKYTKRREAEERKLDPEFEGKVISPRSTPVYIIESYRIGRIVVKGDSATVTVTYKNVGKAEGRNYLTRRIVSRCRTEEVDYSLVFQEQRWWILDPPVARVSAEAMQSNLEAIAGKMGKDWLDRSGLSDVQKEGYRKLQTDIEAIKRLNECIDP